MPAVLGIAIALLLSSCSWYTRPAPPQHRSADQQLESAVRVENHCIADNGFRYGGYGSGVIVSPTEILTAAHVIDCELGGMRQVVVNGQPGVVAFQDPSTDLARVIVAKPLRYVKVTIGDRPSAGDTVCHVSRVPRHDRRCGRVSMLDAPPGNIHHDAFTIPGNSGGGVYGQNGELVGIVTHYRRCPPTGQVCGGAFTSLQGRRLTL